MTQFLTFESRIWVMLSVVILAAITNVIVEFTTQKREDLIPCFFRRRPRKSHDDSGESGEYLQGRCATSSSETSTPTLSTKNGQTVDELTSEHNNAGQNPIFIMYQGRRPSTMSMMSTYSNGGFDSAVNINADLPAILPNGQNPLFLMHQGRRPSAISTYSADSLDATMPSMSTTSDFYVSVDRRRSVTSLSRDSLDGTLPSLGSHDSIPPYPPLTVTTVVCANTDPCRALSTIHECEDHDEDHPPIIGSRKVSIQRSDSYVAALNNINAELSQC